MQTSAPISVAGWVELSSELRKRLLASSSTAALPLALDPGDAEIEPAVAQELGQRVRRFLARQQHGVAEMQPALGIGQELVAENALVDLAAVLVGLAQLDFGGDLGAASARGPAPASAAS